jgi:BarA-like signal transduction histidine kinase
MNLQHTRMKKMIVKLVLILVAVYSESKINRNARKLIRMQDDVVECILEP